MKKKEKFSFRFNLPDHLAKRGALVLISFFFPLSVWAAEGDVVVPVLPPLVEPFKPELPPPLVPPLPVLDHVVQGELLPPIVNGHAVEITQTTQDVVANFHSFNIAEG